MTGEFPFDFPRCKRLLDERIDDALVVLACAGSVSRAQSRRDGPHPCVSIGVADCFSAALPFDVTGAGMVRSCSSDIVFGDDLLCVAAVNLART